MAGIIATGGIKRVKDARRQGKELRMYRLEEEKKNILSLAFYFEMHRKCTVLLCVWSLEAIATPMLNYGDNSDSK